MIDDISKLYQKILEEQEKNNKNVQSIESKDAFLKEEDNSFFDIEVEDEAFDNFLSKLGEKLQEELQYIPEDPKENVSNEIEIPNNNYVSELKKIDKPSSKKVLKENEEITNIISEQIQDEIGKVKTQISRMAIEGGGGSVAVQYAKGGTMRGDLNVIGKYLSGGVDLSTLIGSGGGGGGLSGTTDRLISGSQVFKLNTDGTFNFPNNIITPQDETILTLESTKLLDNYYNRLSLTPYGFFASDHNENSITINSIDNEILIDSQNTYFWKFNNKGALEGPFGTLSVSGNLSATGRVYQNGNDLQTEIENISSFATSTKTTVQSNSASWDYQGSDIKILTGGWVGGNTAYTNLVSNSAAYLSGADLSFLSVSGNWNSVYSTVNSNSATNWNYQGSDLKALSSNWQSTYTTVSSNSAHWDGAYTTLQANSATWGSAVGGTAEVIVAQVHNAETTTLTRGQVVYAFGSNGSIVSVKLASNSSESTSSKTLGFINGTIAPNGTGYVTVAGSMDQLNFGSPFVVGDALWLNSTAGTYTRVKPIAPSHSVYLGVVERANVGNGTAYIKVQNGYELNEIHDVLVNGVSAGEFLQRNSTNTLWVPAPLSADKWNSTYTTVYANSGLWGTGGGGAGSDVTGLSANWESTYTTVKANSAAWGSITSYSSLIGDNITNPLTATHNLNTKDIIFSVREVTTNKIVQAAARTIDNNSLELTFNSTPTVNQYDLTVLCNGGIAGTSSGTTNTFTLTTISSSNYIQNVNYTHFLYNDTITSGQITVTLLPPAYHVAVTQHKKIGSTANVVLSAPNGATIDGQPTYTLMNQYESIGIYTDGTNYFIE